MSFLQLRQDRRSQQPWLILMLGFPSFSVPFSSSLRLSGSYATVWYLCSCPCPRLLSGRPGRNHFGMTLYQRSDSIWKSLNTQLPTPTIPALSSLWASPSSYFVRWLMASLLSFLWIWIWRSLVGVRNPGCLCSDHGGTQGAFCHLRLATVQQHWPCVFIC